MIFAGIDIGSLTAQAVLIEENKIIGWKSIGVRPHPIDSAEAVMGELLAEKGVGQNDISYCVSTGYGREQVQERGLSRENVSEISCHGMGAHSATRGVRTIIDIGGQDAKVIRIDDKGELVDFVMNDKCAAGTGRFLEVMCKTLSVKLDELGPLSRKSKKTMELSTRCSIYAETEVIHYLQRGEDRADIASAVNRAMAVRVSALARRIGVEREVAMTGGVAKNSAVKSSLEKILGVRMLNFRIDPQIIGAYGAAIIARRMGGHK